MGLFRAIGRWFYDRLQLSAIVDLLTKHKAPPGAERGKSGWMYVFGFAVLVSFLVQIATGAALLGKYIPSPESAHASLEYLTHDSSLGAFVRAAHYFGASAMVLLMFLHMGRVFLTGSYKFPREMGWISGVVLLVIVMAMAFTGQLLRWDENGIWTVVVASKFVGRAPFIGRELSELILAGETVGGTTLSRFFSLHVFIFPALILALVGLHLFLVFRNGISEPPKAGQPVDPRTYRAWYAELTEKYGRPYFPWGVWREIVFATGVVGLIIVLALVVGPKGPGALPDLTDLATDPRPDWYLRWYYALIFIKPRGLEEVVMVYAPVLVLLAMIVLPLVASRGERSPARRPMAVLLVAVVVIGFVWLLVLGYRAPWVPRIDTQPLPPELVGAVEGPVHSGAALFHARGCQSCHRVLGHGGLYGPDMTDVAKRISREEITVRTLIGVRDMPAYRDILTTEEMSDIVAFLTSINSRRAEGADGRAELRESGAR